MKSLKRTLGILATLATALGSAFALADRVGDFALLDHQGKHHQLSYYGDLDAVVILVQANGEAASRTAAESLHTLQKQKQGQDIQFFMLNAQGDTSRAEVAAEAEQQAWKIPVLLDETQLVASSLGIERSAEALVIDPEAMRLVYRGPAAGLPKALESGTPGAPSAGEGAAIAYNWRGQEVSYEKDIAGILNENCVSCHHDGGIGPWSMSSHNMVQGWSQMMKEVVMTRRMPPGQIDNEVGVAIDDVNGLSTEEMRKLVAWVDAGAPRDGTSDPLTENTFDNPRYTLGEPDIILKVPPQTIPATGIIDYRYVPVELNLDRDVWVRAMETIPGDRQVLHHVIAYVSSPADKSVRGRRSGAANGESLGGFAPGRQPDVFRDDSGRLVKAGSNLLLQMHYTTSGKETVDATEIGLFIYDEPPSHVMSGGVAGQRRFLIPPHAKEHKLEGEQEVEHDAYLYSLMPHMHYRGKYMSYSAVYPDGREELLLSVPRYEFNWQFNYQLEEPLFLPAGTRLVARGAMDNSDRNPHNPDPTKPVHFGLQTKHEMFFGFTTLRYVGDTPENPINAVDEEEVAGL